MVTTWLSSSRCEPLRFAGKTPALDPAAEQKFHACIFRCAEFAHFLIGAVCCDRPPNRALDQERTFRICAGLFTLSLPQSPPVTAGLDILSKRVAIKLARTSSGGRPHGTQLSAFSNQVFSGPA